MRCRRSLMWIFATFLVVTGALRAAAQEPSCGGDCNGDFRVAVNELVQGVNIVLAAVGVERCPSFDVNQDGRVLVNELVGAVSSSLSTCPCPVTFLDNPREVGRLCAFRGEWSGVCGDSSLPATFAENGGFLGVALVTGAAGGQVTLLAQPIDGWNATLFGAVIDDESHPASGTVRLSDDRRHLFIDGTVTPSFAIEDCEFDRYRGELVELVPVGN